MSNKRFLIGHVGVDSGQLMICDPCYVDSQWTKKPFHDVMTGKKWGWAHPGEEVPKDVTSFPGNFADPIPEIGNKTPNELIKSGRWLSVPEPKTTGKDFNYEGVCNATLGSEQCGQLHYNLGHSGVAVAFASGYGDGLYPVYGYRNKEGRIVKVEIDMQ